MIGLIGMYCKRITKLEADKKALLDALEGLLEDTPQGECDGDCSEDNCPWMRARAAIKQAKEQP